MKRFLILIVIIILTICIWAQTEIEEDTAQDSIKIETVVIDTLDERIDPKQLLVEIIKFLNDKKQMDREFFLPYLIYKENFHISSPFNLNLRITKNGFSEIPFTTGNLQTVQNNQNIYKRIYKRGNIYYNSLEYSLPVAITETYMGLGDIDMNNVSVSLIKGDIFGISNLDLQFDYLGEKGIWQGVENEVIQNSHLYLSYDLDFAKVHFDNSLIDQTLPGEKDIYNYAYPFESASNKENEYSVKIENNIIDIGFIYKNNDYTMEDRFHKERDLMQVLAQKKFQILNHQLDFSYEYVAEDIIISSYSNPDSTIIIKRDDSFYIISGDHESNIFGFKLGDTGYYQDENNFQLDSELTKEVFYGLNLLGEFTTRSGEYFTNLTDIFPQRQSRSDVGGGIVIVFPLIRTRAVMGQHHIEDFNGNYYYLQNSINLGLTKNIGFKFDQWLRNEQINYRVESNTDIWKYPEWQMSNFLELTYSLKYNNAIKLGLKHIYHSSYSYTLDDMDTIFQNDTQNFNAYLKIQLTNNFEISIDAVNLTNNKIMFTNSNHPGTHFNFNVHWIFMN